MGLTEARRRAKRQGWRIEKCKSGHEKWFSPNGVDIVTVSATPSDHRAMVNAHQDLKRAGLK